MEKGIENNKGYGHVFQTYVLI